MTARIVLDAVVMLTALVLQLSVVNLLPLPGGGPDLVLIGLASLAFVQGELGGAVLGFLSGLALDLVPPSDGPVGRWAFVLCLVGYVAGRVGPWVRESALRAVGAIGALGLASVVVFAAVSALLGDVGLTARSVATVALATAGYDVLLAPFLAPVLMGLARRAEPTPQRL